MLHLTITAPGITVTFSFLLVEPTIIRKSDYWNPSEIMKGIQQVDECLYVHHQQSLKRGTVEHESLDYSCTQDIFLYCYYYYLQVDVT